MINDFTISALKALGLDVFVILGSVIRVQDINGIMVPLTVDQQTALDAGIIQAEADYIALEYSRLRKVAYDKLNQDEMRYDDLINITTTWQDAISAIKLQFPK